MTLSDVRNIVHGSVARGFEPVRDVFVENFRRRGEVGAACAVYLRGDKVVDLWGGQRDVVTGALGRGPEVRPKAERHPEGALDTMVLVFSTTKGMSALALAVAHSRGFLQHDECVSTYWPPAWCARSWRTVTLRDATYECVRRTA